MATLQHRGWLEFDEYEQYVMAQQPSSQFKVVGTLRAGKLAS